MLSSCVNGLCLTAPLGASAERHQEISAGSLFNPLLPSLWSVAFGKLNFLLTNPDGAERRVRKHQQSWDLESPSGPDLLSEVHLLPSTTLRSLRKLLPILWCLVKPTYSHLITCKTCILFLEASALTSSTFPTTHFPEYGKLSLRRQIWGWDLCQALGVWECHRVSLHWVVNAVHFKN